MPTVDCERQMLSPLRRPDLRVETGARRIEARFEHRPVGVTRFRAVRIRGRDQRHHLRVDAVRAGCVRTAARNTMSSREHGKPEEHHQHDEHRQQESAAEDGRDNAG